MNVTQHSTILLACVLASAVAHAGQKRPASLTVAQQLADDFVSSHPELTALEIALTSADGCKTVAATAAEDIGEKCDADELGPIRTGKADIEAPTKADPVYDITQALHDARGHLIGAVGMDLKPTIGPRAAVVARALALLHEFEPRIPSKAALLEPVARLEPAASR